MISNTATAYVMQDKRNINIKELARLFNLAKGYRNTNQFLNDCGIYEDKSIIIDILNERFNPALRVHHLRKVVQASEYRVILDQVASASGLTINDTTAELKNIPVMRSGIYMCNMGNILDNEQGGIRPVVVLANQKGLDASGLAIIAPVTGATGKNKLPTHVAMGYESGLLKPSELLLEQITRVSKRRLLLNGEVQRIGRVPDHIMQQIDSAIKKSLGLISLYVDEQIIKDYLLAIKGIEDAKRFRNTSALQMAYTIIMGKLEDYCDDYDIDHKTLLSEYKYENQVDVQNTLQYKDHKYKLQPAI